MERADAVCSKEALLESLFCDFYLIFLVYLYSEAAINLSLILIKIIADKYIYIVCNVLESYIQNSE